MGVARPSRAEEEVGVVLGDRAAAGNEKRAQRSRTAACSAGVPDAYRVSEAVAVAVAGSSE
jgi:hypothetical protein